MDDSVVSRPVASPREATPAPASVGPPTAASPPASSRVAALPWIIRRVWYVSSFLLVGFIVFSSVEGLLQTNSLDGRIAETRAEIIELRLDADQLAALVAWLDSDAYIERIAREDLGMVRPGEESFAVRAPRRGELEIDRSPWWANLLPDSAP